MSINKRSLSRNNVDKLKELYMLWTNCLPLSVENAEENDYLLYLFVKILY